MGNKTNPNALRLGYIHDWQSKWFSIKDAPTLIGEDFKIRNIVRKTFKAAAVSWVGIERTGTFLRVFIHTARPGVVIGKKGADIESLRKEVEAISQRQTRVNVVEIKDPELDSRLVAESIAAQLEKRIAHRRAMKRAMERTLQSGALGIKVMVSGRINGAEISRREWNREGRVPLHTFAADVDYGTAEAMTSAGIIGVKVWIFKKQHFVKSFKELQQMAKKEAALAAAAMAVESGSDASPVPASAEVEAVAAKVEGGK
jgi:small subunit ribosomal protein S3